VIKISEIDQRNIQTWNQENQDKLSSWKVLVIGSDRLAQLVLGSLAGLGVGYRPNGGFILGLDDARIKRNDFSFLAPYDEYKIGKERVKEFKKVISLIKEDCHYLPLFADFNVARVYHHQPNIVIEASNDPLSKERALNYALSYHIPFLSLSCNREKGALCCYWPKNDVNKKKNNLNLVKENPDLENLVLAEFAGSSQETFTAAVVAGLALEEIRKYTFRYVDKNGKELSFDQQGVSNKKYFYNPYSFSRSGKESDAKPKLINYFRNRKVLLVGAGALGNFLALGLADLGIKQLDILDLDTIEASNLNRQLLLYGRIGEKKAPVLAERCQELDHSLVIRSIYGKIGRVDLREDRVWLEQLYAAEKKQWESKPLTLRENSFPTDLRSFAEKYYSLTTEERLDGVKLVAREELAQQDYDLLLGGVDNKFARLWLNEFSRKNKVPYIDGGTSPQSGQLAVYLPGKTQCVECQVNLQQLPSRNSCIEGPQASVVMSNMIIGGMMLGEAVKVWQNDLDPGRKNLTVKYDIFDKNRIYLQPEMVAEGGHC